MPMFIFLSALVIFCDAAEAVVVAGPELWKSFRGLFLFQPAIVSVGAFHHFSLDRLFDRPFSFRLVKLQHYPRDFLRFFFAIHAHFFLLSAYRFKT
ncbi:MAG: hypothetical protein UW30_C0002G0023 [Candidatus Giovannonibacteria bacterium GW2011_GWA2_44_13b]|uniref:Uncharacterized protein n=1 Tax=Candidatus Giovannonibacteria bacterium GW2011_GWA2_44_13b TaxID=1618647 RepID=A0A0G1JDQ5_9BACT|nr:MAG: hypothetical protein UW30_C0002G0023 [Candidatus Giovannonibacteria bacterium GW2011_GWA2_44_13b]